MFSNSIRLIVGDEFITEIILTAAARQAGVNPAEIYVACRREKRCVQLREQYNVRAVLDTSEILPKVKVLMLAFPFGKVTERELADIAKKIPGDAIIISCVYGLRIPAIEKIFQGHAVIRVMMNPMIVTGAGICVYALGGVKAEDSENIAQFLFKSMGKAIKFDSEAELESVGELIISSTIYSFLAVNALIEGGRKSGIDVEKTREVVSQVIAGTVETLINSDAVIDYLIQQGQEQKNLLKRSKPILERYGVIDYMRKSLASADTDEISKFRYRYWQ